MRKLVQVGVVLGLMLVPNWGESVPAATVPDPSDSSQSTLERDWTIFSLLWLF